jgi:crotonobetainyl-CoA:carnitine CoA-transferase CaiB-like acyl-CoA transferase
MQILRGIRVIDLSMWAFVPSAGGVLSHWGADVIKIENPGAADPSRFLYGGSLAPGDSGWSFKHYNRGKRAIALDLASDQGREILYRLVEGADVFLTSFLTDTRRKLGIDLDDIRARNPTIVYAKGTGHGPLGPEAERSGYDGVTWWCRGSLADSTMRVSGAASPTAMVGHGDGMSGMTLAGGICAALLQREREGIAPVVDGSLLGTAIWFNGPAIIGAKASEATGGRYEALAQSAGMGTFRTKDDRFLRLSFLGDRDEDWTGLFEHAGRPELGADPRFATSTARAGNQADLEETLEMVFAQRTLEDWKRDLVTMTGAWAPIATAREVHDDPQTVANGFVRDVPYPNGPFAVPVPGVLFDRDAGDPQPAPDFAQHTDEVLREAGFSDAEVASFRAARVVA